MRLPSWLRVRRTRRTSPRTVTVTLVADVGAYIGGMEQASRRLSELAGRRTYAGIFDPDLVDRMVAQIHKFARWLEVHIAGIQARYYVRGGADPTYADPDARDAYVLEILRTELLGNYAAAAFIAGWCDTYGQGDRDRYTRQMVLPDTTWQTFA